MRQSVKWLVAAALCLGAIPALAQVGTIVSFVGSTYLKPPYAIEIFTKASPVSGTMVFGKHQQEMQIGGTSTISALTITLNPNPDDGQVNCFYTKPIVTALTLSTPPTGQTLNDAVTATTATTRYCYLYSASNLTWDRIQ